MSLSIIQVQIIIGLNNLNMNKNSAYMYTNVTSYITKPQIIQIKFP